MNTKTLWAFHEELGSLINEYARTKYYAEKLLEDMSSSKIRRKFLTGEAIRLVHNSVNGPQWSIEDDNYF